MLQRILQSKLLWRFALMMRRRQFSFTDQGYIRLTGKRGKSVKHTDGTIEKGYQPYLRLSYDSYHGWYYRADGSVGECSYEDVITMVKLFIKYDKLRTIKFC